jgi:replicative DNA helicase
MSETSLTILEKQILAQCLTHPDRPLSYEDTFVSTAGQEIHRALVEMAGKGIKFNDSDLLRIANERHDGAVTPALLESIRKEDYDPTKFDSYYQSLRKEKAKEDLTRELLTSITEIISSKEEGELDIELLNETMLKVSNRIAILSGKSDELRTMRGMLDAYALVLEDRAENGGSRTTGCSQLDKYYVTGFSAGEITTIFGSTGVGKSTYARYLINRLVNMEIPVLDCSLEMSETAVMDRWMAARTRTSLHEFYDTGTSQESRDRVDHLFKQERSKLSQKLKYAFIEDGSISLPRLRELIEKAKVQLSSKYIVVVVDLLTMVKEFSGGESTDYEGAMNSLNDIVKSTGVHLVAVVQALQKQLEANPPRKYKDIEKLRPHLASIKNSSVIAERSRCVLGAFRSKYYATRFFPNDPVVDQLDDLLEIQILKQSQGAVGHILNYLYDAECFRVYSIPEDYSPVRVTQLADLADADDPDGGGTDIDD